MAYSEKAKQYHEKMFPDQPADLSGPDREYIERYENFAYDEVVKETKLDDRTLYLSHLATAMGAGAMDEFGVLVPAALNFGLTPEEIKEVVYQGTAYLGMHRVYPFLVKVNEVFKKNGVKETEESKLTNTEETRRETGTACQVEAFGEGMQDAWKNGTVNYWLADYCFGDYYTRKYLSMKDRELITFCFIYAQGGCENQLRGHTKGNIAVGNTKEVLIDVVQQNIPYMGFPRSLNAIAIINEVTSEK